MTLHRSIKIKSSSGEDITLNISKASALKIKAKLLHLDELPDGTWRITYSSLMIPDFMKVKSLDFIGLDNGICKVLEDVTIQWRGIGYIASLVKVVPVKGNHRMIHLDHDLKTDKWKMIYNESMISDVKQLQSFTMHRSD